MYGDVTTLSSILRVCNGELDKFIEWRIVNTHSLNILKLNELKFYYKFENRLSQTKG